MSIIERSLSSSQTSDQTIDDFPLPPGTPRLVPNNHEMQDNSVPEFDQNFRFPIINHPIDQDELNDPELTCQRLRNEVETMAARLALDFAGLESTRTSENLENYQSNSHCRYNTSHSKIRPKTSHGRVEAPRFPFGDFAEWDLELESDEINDPKHVTEDKVKPYVSSRSRASSLHSCRNRRPMKKAEFIIPVHARKFIIAQERARVDQERAAAVSENDDILCQTREAVHHISEAGFDFGFGESEPNLSGSTGDFRLNPANLSNVESDSNITKTVVKLPQKLSTQMMSEVHSHNSQSLAWPRNSDTFQWSNPGLTDSGIALASPNLDPNSAPPHITTFSDLPEPLRLNCGTKNIPSNLESNYINISTRELSCWSITPDLIKDVGPCPEASNNANPNFPVHGNVERRKWMGFWGRMKNSMFSKKRSTSTTKATLTSQKQ